MTIFVFTFGGFDQQIQIKPPTACHDNQLLTDTLKCLFPSIGVGKGLKPGPNKKRETHKAPNTGHGRHGNPPCGGAWRVKAPKENLLMATGTSNIAAATHTGQCTYDDVVRRKRGGGGGRFWQLLSNRSHSDAHLHHLRLEKWCDGSVSGKMDTWHGTKTTSERSKKKTNPGLAAVAFRAVTGSAWPGPHAPSKYRLLREPIAAARLERATLESMKSRGTSEDSGAHPLARWLAGWRWRSRVLV